MRVKYKGYTLILDFSKVGMYVPTFIQELRRQFDDIAKAKHYIDTL